MHKKNEFPEKLLSDRKLKATGTRVELLHFLSESEGAISYSKIQEEFKESDRITLYRTLHTLLNKGIIHKAMESKEETYYALCGSNCTDDTHYHNHVHFKCSSCDQVTCEELDHQISIPLKNFRIDKVNINLVGLCSNCNHR